MTTLTVRGSSGEGVTLAPVPLEGLHNHYITSHNAARTGDTPQNFCYIDPVTNQIHWLPDDARFAVTDETGNVVFNQMSVAHARNEAHGEAAAHGETTTVSRLFFPGEPPGPLDPLRAEAILVALKRDYSDYNKDITVADLQKKKRNYDSKRLSRVAATGYAPSDPNRGALGAWPAMYADLTPVPDPITHVARLPAHMLSPLAPMPERPVPRQISDTHATTRNGRRLAEQT